MKFIDGNDIYPELPNKAMEGVRTAALNNFTLFVKLVASFQQMGHCHEDLCRWMQDQGSGYKLILWPRDHCKSRYSAFYASWQLARNPAISIIYASATATLAEKMLTFIKTNILEAPKFREYFPNLINAEEGRRKKWTGSEIIVDHPLRDELGSSDPTIKVAGVGANITGHHCDLMIFDDVVVYKNTCQEGPGGREKVNGWVGSMASILSAENDCLVVGTRYHPKDAYQSMIDETHDIFDEATGELIDTKHTYTVSQANVEEDGQYLWPRKVSKDGRAYGFNKNILSKKKSQYISKGQTTQFYAQYYNDPNDRSSAPISRDLFRYYDKSDLTEHGGMWSINDKPLAIYCTIDPAATIGTRSDYTAICVGGIDPEGVKYLLDAIRYKTDKISDTVNKTDLLYTKWKFKALRIEAVGAFSMVAKDIIVQLQNKGIRIPMELYNPGTMHKDLRILNILEPAYQAQSVFHFRGGTAESLEDEIISLRPAHDDLKDAWAMCIDPEFMKIIRPRKRVSRSNVLKFNKRYGGVDYGTIGNR